MTRLRCGVWAVLLLAVSASPVLALDSGWAKGSVIIDGTPKSVAFASSASEENLFDSAKQDAVIALSDRPLDDVSPADRYELAARVGRGEVVAIVPRFDGSKLVNVGVGLVGESSLTLLPGAWFEASLGTDGVGRVKLAARSSEGHTYACDVTFHAKAYVPPGVEGTPEPAAAPAAESEPITPSTESRVDPKAGVTLLIAAMMQKDEHQALELIKLGTDPNGRDSYGIPVLNWAVMMCMPAVVQALVDRKADLAYERSPGLTLLTEAGACPEAEKILKAAGAK